MNSSRPIPWFCAQLGAREHYAVPRALHRTGRLSLLCTDFWAGSSLRAAAQFVPVRGLRSLAARFHPELDGRRGAKRETKVRSWNLKSLTWEAKLRRCSRSQDSGGVYLGFIEVGREFATAVREELKRRRDWSPETLFFAYDTGALETLEWLRERGAPCVVDQIDPCRVEVEMVREEEKRWPGWTTCASEVPEAYFRRREREWALADRVVVNSEFSRQALIQQGVPSSKLSVIPLCYEAPRPRLSKDGRLLDGQRPKHPAPFPFSSLRPLRVLWLGQVILRKGIQYLLQAARLLADEKVQFDVVGPIGISVEAVKSAPSNVTFHGQASRDQAGLWYQRADVFVLPTLSDGFALTQLEAMAHGLPVIATPNCGEVVANGVDGFIVPPRDAESLAGAIRHYLAEPDLLRHNEVAALKKVGQFTFSHLANHLGGLEAELTGSACMTNSRKGHELQLDA